MKKATTQKTAKHDMAIAMEIKKLEKEQVECANRALRENTIESFNRRESFIDYKDLPEGIRSIVSYANFSSTGFKENAKNNNFSPYQWAGVVYLVTVSNNKVKAEDFKSMGEWGLVVNGNLDLTGQITLACLPDGIVVKGSLSLSGCINLKQLPAGLTVGGALWLDGCTSLQELPDNLTVGTGLSLHSCKSVHGLPEKLILNGWLTLANCSRQVKQDARILKEKGKIKGWIYTS
jgi:hypothetical protein